VKNKIADETQMVKCETKVKKRWRVAFLQAVAAGRNFTDACKEAKVSRPVVWRNLALPRFKREYEWAKKCANERLEVEAYTRAINGSDRLLEFMLKSRMPEVYGDKMHLKTTHETTLTLADISAKLKSRASLAGAN